MVGGDDTLEWTKGTGLLAYMLGRNADEAASWMDRNREGLAAR